MNGKTIIILTLLLISACLINFFQACKTKKPQEVTIGVVLPLTGDYSPYGLSCKDGMDLALDEFLEKFEGIDVKASYQDNKSTTRDGVNAIQKLINVDKVPLVIGGMASTIALAMAPIAERSKTILLIPFASSPRISYAGQFIFRIMPSDAFQAVLVPEWMAEDKIERVGIIYVNNDWGVSLKEEFIRNASQYKIKVLFEEGINEGIRDFRQVIAKFRNLDLDALFLQKRNHT